MQTLKHFTTWSLPGLPGGVADLVVPREKNVVETLRNHEAPLHVIAGGKLIDQLKVAAIN
jgi:hypothetical protein